MSVEEKSSEPIKSLPIKWDSGSKNTTTRYATNITIQHTENEFFLSFYEIRPPLLLGNQDEISREIDNIDYVEAECVARIAVCPNKMHTILKAMQENYDNFIKNFHSVNEDRG